MFGVFSKTGLVYGRNPGALSIQPQPFCDDDSDECADYSKSQTKNQTIVLEPFSKPEICAALDDTVVEWHPPMMDKKDEKSEKMGMNRPYYLTKNQQTEETEVRVWPGKDQAGADALMAGVPEFVEDQNRVYYPDHRNDGVRCELFPWSWTVFLDRRFFDRDLWPYTDPAKVAGCNRYSTSVKTPKLLFYDRDWKQLVWAKILKKNGRLSGEKFTVQIQRDWAKNRATLTVGAKVGYNPRTGDRNHNSLSCNVCSTDSHIQGVSPCIMIVVDALPTQLKSMPNAVISDALHSRVMPPIISSASVTPSPTRSTNPTPLGFPGQWGVNSTHDTRRKRNLAEMDGLFDDEKIKEDEREDDEEYPPCYKKRKIIDDDYCTDPIDYFKDEDWPDYWLFSEKH